jgi:predicted transcriptional regulator
MNYAQLEDILRTLVETGQIETDARGLYLITAKGIETL